MVNCYTGLNANFTQASYIHIYIFQSLPRAQGNGFNNISIIRILSDIDCEFILCTAYVNNLQLSAISLIKPRFKQVFMIIADGDSFNKKQHMEASQVAVIPICVYLILKYIISKKTLFVNRE